MKKSRKKSSRSTAKNRDDLFLGLGLGALIGYLIAKSMSKKAESSGTPSGGGNFNLPGGGQVATGGANMIAPPVSSSTNNNRGYILKEFPYTGGCGAGTISTVHKVV